MNSALFTDKEAVGEPVAEPLNSTVPSLSTNLTGIVPNGPPHILASKFT